MIDHIDEKKKFAGLMTALSDYYRQEISKGVMALYWEGLRQYDYEAVEKAAWAHTQSPDEAGRWMPKISDLTKMLVGRTEDQANLAWSKVDSAVRTPGVYVDVVFDDPIIHRVLADMGGWASLGSKLDKEWPFIAKEFITRYQGFRMNGQIPDYPHKLTGMANTQNSAQYRISGVRLIGNIETAKMVMRGDLTALAAPKSSDKKKIKELG